MLAFFNQKEKASELTQSGLLSFQHQNEQTRKQIRGRSVNHFLLSMGDCLGGKLS